MTVLSYNENSNWLICSRNDIGIQRMPFPGSTTIITPEITIKSYEPYEIFHSDSNQTVFIKGILITKSQTTLTQFGKPNKIEDRIEKIIDLVLFEKTISSSVDKNELKDYLIEKFKKVGFHKFFFLSDDIIKKRIEKVVTIELLKNLFSDITEEEFNAIKSHAKSEAFFR